MNNIKINSNTDNDKDELDDRINSLLERARAINKDVKDTNSALEEEYKKVNAEADSAIKDIDKITEDLAKADKEAENELDTLILKESEDLASEE